MALYFAFYRFCRMHKSLRMSPAMAAGVFDRLWSREDIAERIEAKNPSRPEAVRRRLCEEL